MRASVVIAGEQELKRATRGGGGKQAMWHVVTLDSQQQIGDHVKSSQVKSLSYLSKLVMYCGVGAMHGVRCRLQHKRTIRTSCVTSFQRPSPSGTAARVRGQPPATQSLHKTQASGESSQVKTSQVKSGSGIW